VTAPVLISFTVPIYTPSLTNLREHYMTRSKRAKLHRLATKAAWAKGVPDDRERFAATALAAGHGLSITLTRISPRRIDMPNCGAALKHVVDQVADELGIDDGDPKHTWIFRQESGEPGVRVEVLVEIA
jgi:hypothetical protein